MLKGGGQSIPYTTVVEYLEYLDVYEAIEEQNNLEMQQKHEKAMQQAQQKRGGR